jgi:hypothetical protein
MICLPLKVQIFKTKSEQFKLNFTQLRLHAGRLISLSSKLHKSSTENRQPNA